MGGRRKLRPRAPVPQGRRAPLPPGGPGNQVCSGGAWRLLLADPSATFASSDASFSIQATYGPRGTPARHAGSSAPGTEWGAWQPGPGAQLPRGFLQASLGLQGLWWPLLSNPGSGRGLVAEGKDWKERLQGQGSSWVTRFAWELPGSNRPQRPPQGPAPMGDGAQRSSGPCPQRKPRATGKLLGKVCQALSLCQVCPGPPAFPLCGRTGTWVPGG